LQENLPNLSEKELSNGHPVKSDVGAKDPTIPDEQGLDPKVYPQLRKTGTASLLPMERVRNFSPPVVNKLKDSYLKR
jgi:hypothetical protein